MRLETFSYLPELSSDQLTQQIRSILGRHLVVGIEHTSAPDPYDHYWTMWKLPLSTPMTPRSCWPSSMHAGRPTPAPSSRSTATIRQLLLLYHLVTARAVIALGGQSARATTQPGPDRSVPDPVPAANS
jgi:hypothetical protein